ncbi:MAG: transcription-repair coupling factor [Candidatus Omnitrophica bacterium]|nr:transcription-repair coupling factor [Candidatus Omnitrophota bacterium]
MFKSIKFYVEQFINIESIVAELLHFGYKRSRNALIEGDFCQRGEIIDIFPVNFDGPVRVALDDSKIRFIYSYNIKSNKPVWQHKIVIILPRKAPSNESFSPEEPLDHFVDIQKGDYVVHYNHGIGRFLGIKPIDTKQQKKEHMIIEYKGGDRLYIPKHDMHLIQKYVGFSKKPPRIYTLGSKEWKRIKSQTHKRIQRVAAELLRVQALRATLKGFKYKKDDKWQKDFEAGFAFEETPDQIKATAALKKDMEDDSPMDRLLCGDVGFGKTEVALRAAFKAVMNNKQVALLVPTTILAEQHFYNFSDRLQDFPINVAMLSRFRTKHEQQEIVKDLRSGTVDIVIGTHRLLSKDIAFKNLGLIIIDEEQRFGVRSKEKLKHLKVMADVLAMTATPIPRTLYMALSGSKDMSVISTPPKNRVPVETQIIAFDENIIKKAMLRELRRKGQIFFLHNRVEDISKVAKIINRLVPGAVVAVGHGQMPGRLLEKIMLGFIKGKIDILVCTTIIESGIDIPNANTLFVNRADHFGLADLHQLRGRVGRSTNQAYAYFITPPKKIISSVSQNRLEALGKYSELGSGFQIAFEDLQLRGSGNILGEEQSGYIAAVGFDLYCRLLKDSIEHIKNKKG